MIHKHLSDNELQLFVSDRTSCPKELVDHLNTCPECQLKASNYAKLFDELNLVPLYKFDFDVAELVLSNLSSKPGKVILPGYASRILYAAAIIIIAVSFYINLPALFQNIRQLLNLLTIFAAALISIFQAIEKWKLHRFKMIQLTPHHVSKIY